MSNVALFLGLTALYVAFLAGFALMIMGAATVP
jgi:hypothetical protein